VRFHDATRPPTLHKFRYLHGQTRALPLSSTRVRPECHRAQSCAIALRSPAPERSSDHEIHQIACPRCISPSQELKRTKRGAHGAHHRWMVLFGIDDFPERIRPVTTLSSGAVLSGSRSVPAILTKHGMPPSPLLPARTVGHTPGVQQRAPSSRAELSYLHDTSDTQPMSPGPAYLVPGFSSSVSQAS
jgi:hypothetical protein